MTLKPTTILVVEDDEIDFMSIKRTLQDLHVLNDVRHAKDGVEALQILRGTDGAEKLDLPAIIFLDLNMPRMNGIEFLEEIRADDLLSAVPVFMSTTSETDDDITAAYSREVNGYIFKSDLKDSLREVIEGLTTYRTIMGSA